MAIFVLPISIAIMFIIRGPSSVRRVTYFIPYFLAPVNLCRNRTGHEKSQDSRGQTAPSGHYVCRVCHKGPELTRPEDRDLIEAVLAGEKAAYGQLYDRYAPLVRAICCDTAGNLADAQDLAQDVFMRAYEKLDHLRDPARFGKWLVGIARLRCKEWQRQKLRAQSKQTRLRIADPFISDPSNDGRIERLREMIPRLSEKERLALHAFYLQGRSADNARTIMGLSRSGFYCVLERARKRLEKLMSGEQENIR